MIACVALSRIRHQACNAMRHIPFPWSRSPETVVKSNGRDARRLKCGAGAGLQAVTALLLTGFWVSPAVASPLLIAHRGASHDAPENTLAAFKLAWQQGADGIELDLQLTKDGHVVCIHDADTRSVSDRKRIVRNSTLQELQTLDVGVHHGEAFRGERIPTLEEVVKTVPAGKLVYLDIKTGAEIIPPVMAILKSSQLAADQVVFLAFDQGIVRAIKEQAPQYKVYWLCRVRKGLLFREFRPSIVSVIETLRKSGADGLASRHSDISDGFVTAVIAAGFEHHVWTVNDTRQAARFHKLGTKSIITSIPESLREIFANEPR